MKTNNTLGIILAGGNATRMGPLTKAVSKQLLPIYDKPTIFYPLSVLMLSGIKDILIITKMEDQNSFNKLLGDGKTLGLNIKYVIQKIPHGLPDAFICSEDYIKKKNVALILGDNFFYGQGFTNRLRNSIKRNIGATIFLYPVKNPENFGIAELNKGKIKNIYEKPKKSKSNLAITGLYFFSNEAVKISKSLKKSLRGELEITDLIKKYQNKKKLRYELIGRGGAWLDTGNADQLLDASHFVSTVEKRQGMKIACLEEISLNNNWITKKELKERILLFKNSEYGEYLKKIQIK
jgi:glucose-1-phosphate thymidylyltransferase